MTGEPDGTDVDADHARRAGVGRDEAAVLSVDEAPSQVSRWRALFVIVPVIVIAAVATNLLGVWSTPQQEAQREAARREALARPVPRATPDEPRVAEPEAPVSAGLEFDLAAVLALIPNSDPANGESDFRLCRACHVAERDDADLVGPNLWGVVGRPKASLAGYRYSDALRSKGGAWSYADLAAYLNNPRAFAPGTSMTFRGIENTTRMANILAYLRVQADTIEPLP